MLDLAIIGGGPAALSAAIYAARAGLKVTVYEKGSVGGALPQIAKIENYPGFVGSGADLAKIMREQAQTVGAEICYGEVTELLAHSGGYDRGLGPEARDDGPEGPGAKSFVTLRIDDASVSARAALVATGSEPIPLDIKTDKPVSYCALCDGALYRNQDIAVVGGGNSAVQESLHLAKIVRHLTLFSHSKLKADACLIAKLKALENVTIKENTTPTNFDDFAAIFTFIGKRPATSFLPAEVLTAAGYIKTDNYMTAIPGLFAAGDVRDDSVKQAIAAAADGAAAAIAITKFLQK